MELPPLTKDEIKRVIEGKGNASRIPLLYHFWINPGAFDKDKQAQVAILLNQCPMDVQIKSPRMPDVYEAPQDDPSFRWGYRDVPHGTKALDNAGVIEDWEEELNLFLADFPDPDDHGLIPEVPADDGRYKLGTW